MELLASVLHSAVLTPAEEELLTDGASRLGLVLSPAQVNQFAGFRALLLDWNTRVNLTRIVDPAQVLTRHFLDSLTVVLALPSEARGQALTVIDVGAGAGLPGLALQIMFPAWRVVLLDSVGKKTRFVAAVAASLGLEGATVLHARAEDAGHDPMHRETYDLCLARAVAPLDVLVEYTTPFCRLGGLVVAMKKGDVHAEVVAARRAAGQVGGRIERLVPVPEIADLGDDRVLVPIRKIQATRADLPRQAGLPSRQPL